MLAEAVDTLLALAPLRPYGLALVLFVTATAMLVARSRRASLDRRRVSATAVLENHYVVWGFGRRGREVAAILREADIPFVVVPANDVELRLAHEHGDWAVAGTSLGERLCCAGIGGARGLLVMSTSAQDAFRLITAARARSRRLLVVATSADERAEETLISAGADRVVPDRLSAENVVALLPECQQDARMEQDRVTSLYASELTITPEQAAAFGDMDTVARVCRANDLVLSIRRASPLQPAPAADSSLGEGDVIVVVGSKAAIRSVDELLRPTAAQ